LRQELFRKVCQNIERYVKETADVLGEHATIVEGSERLTTNGA
jgi:hypothetical protein